MPWEPATNGALSTTAEAKPTKMATSKGPTEPRRNVGTTKTELQNSEKMIRLGFLMLISDCWFDSWIFMVLFMTFEFLEFLNLSRLMIFFCPKFWCLMEPGHHGVNGAHLAQLLGQGLVVLGWNEYWLSLVKQSKKWPWWHGGFLLVNIFKLDILRCSFLGFCWFKQWCCFWILVVAFGLRGETFRASPTAAFAYPLQTAQETKSTPKNGQHRAPKINHLYHL